MRATENEKRDWSVIALILLLGLLALLLAGGWALRFTPRWDLDASVESRLDPNSDFLTRKPEKFIEPIDPAILTNPAWINNVLTPGAALSAVPQIPVTAGASQITSTAGTFVATQTVTMALATNTVLASPTNTLIYFPPTVTSTTKSNPVPTSTSVVASPTPTSTSTGAATFTPIASDTPSQTFTPTATATLTPADTQTNTPTSTATFTATPTPTSTTPPFCTTTIVITGPSGSYAKPGGSTCFEYTDTFANGGVFQITSTGVNGTVDGSSCPGTSISSGSTISYGVAQSGGLMMFRITGTAGTLDINISDWTTHPACP
jgi:hypothetical protein